MSIMLSVAKAMWGYQDGKIGSTLASNGGLSAEHDNALVLVAQYFRIM